MTGLIKLLTFNLSHNLNYNPDYGVLIIIAIMIGMLFVQPMIGLISDKIDNKPLLVAVLVY